MFTKLIRLSDKISASLPGCTNYIKYKRLYEELEDGFLKKTILTTTHHNLHGTYYEELTYKGKKYYFKVRLTMDDWKCYIDFTTDPDGWSKDII